MPSHPASDDGSGHPGCVAILSRYPRGGKTGVDARDAGRNSGDSLSPQRSPPMSLEPIHLTLEQEDGFAFRISFDDTGLASLLADESPPLGEDRGPNPQRLLLAAVANCLSASLLFALRKFHNEAGRITAKIEAVPERNAEGRWRIPRARVELRLDGPAGDYRQLPRILGQFEDFCVVTQSVRHGIDVDVRVVDGDGKVLSGGA
jgi:uncharacterized OsmC-like protein